jgi:hypothetical protein
MLQRKNLIQNGFRFHRGLVWSALAALLIFVVSGFLHVLVTWVGPQTAVQQPPQHRFTTGQLQAVIPVLQQHNIQQARIVKLVPSAQGALLQVTVDPLMPRRYFDLHSGAELRDYDEIQARWLASHYLAGREHAVADVQFQTAFDSDYPWVNRLLPVYKIRLADSDGLTLYLHTETLALAAITDNSKQQVQWLFRQLHTFSWLEPFRHGRVVLMALLLLSLLGMLISGLCLLYALRRKSAVTPARQVHRWVAHGVAIPLLGFTASGFYHLLHNEYGATATDFNIAQPLNVPAAVALQPGALAVLSQDLHGVNLLRVADQLYFRASLAPAMAGGGEHDHHAVRQQRFDGVPREQGSRYLSLQHDAQPSLTDEAVARQLVMAHLNLTSEQVIAVEKITHFGPGYDFRNKRLPVWKVTVAARPWDVLYVDVASGVLVDRSSTASRLENLSFSFLHKWNFLVMPLGRENRDLLLSLVLGLTLLLALLGLRVRLARRR